MLYPKYPWDANYYSSKEEFQLWLMQEWGPCRQEWYKEYYIRSTAEPMGNKSYREDALLGTFKTREEAETAKADAERRDYEEWDARVNAEFRASGKPPRVRAVGRRR